MPLRLDLFRHGDADPAGPDGDSSRPLSSQGRRDVARVAEEYARQGWRPDRILASPLRRAQETAAILVARAAPSVRLETLRALVPDHSAEELTEALRDLGLTGHVVLIGHQPLLGQLAKVLLGGELTGFPPGGMAGVELPRGLVAGAGALVARVLPDRLG